MILVFWVLSFKSVFSLSSFTFIRRLFSSSSLSAIRVVSSAYLRLLTFLPAILTPACASFSPAFLMMYSAQKLNKQGDNIQPWYTPFPIWNQSVVPCPVVAGFLCGPYYAEAVSLCFYFVECFCQDKVLILSNFLHGCGFFICLLFTSSVMWDIRLIFIYWKILAFWEKTLPWNVICLICW